MSRYSILLKKKRSLISLIAEILWTTVLLLSPFIIIAVISVLLT